MMRIHYLMYMSILGSDSNLREGVESPGLLRMLKAHGHFPPYTDSCGPAGMTDSKGNKVIVCDNGTGVSRAGPVGGMREGGGVHSKQRTVHELCLFVRSCGMICAALKACSPSLPAVREVRLCRLQFPLAHIPLASGPTHHPLLGQSGGH